VVFGIGGMVAGGGVPGDGDRLAVNNGQGRPAASSATREPVAWHPRASAGTRFTGGFTKAPPMLSYLRLFLPYSQIARSVADRDHVSRTLARAAAAGQSHRRCQAAARRAS
jgi:hypothetical protein